jgi:hypothetical protein
MRRRRILKVIHGVPSGSTVLAAIAIRIGIVVWARRQSNRDFPLLRSRSNQSSRDLLARS